VDRQHLQRLWVTGHVLERVELAVETRAGGAARPESAQDVDRLVGAAAPGRVVDSDGGGLAREAADPDREQAHATAGEHVDRRQALGQPHRVVKGQQQHARAEQDRRRRRGDEGQTLEGVGDRQIRRELHLADPRARVQRDVLGHVERLETQVVGVAGDRLQVCRVGAREAGVVTEAEFHTSKFSQTETRERTRARKVLRPVLPAVAQAEPRCSHRPQTSRN
jgi:hypothetical protein